MVNENFHEFHYESTNPVQNLEIVFLVSCFLFFLPLLFKIVESIFRCGVVHEKLMEFKHT